MSGVSRNVDRLLTLGGEDEPEIRALLLRTLLEDDILSLAALFWTQTCWLAILLTAGWPAIVVLMGLDLLIFATRWRFRQRTIRGGADPDSRTLVLLILASTALIACETILLFEASSLRAAALGIILPIGFLGYSSSIQAGFPRLATINLTLLTTALTCGLALSAFDDLRLLALIIPCGGAAFYVLMRRTHASLIESVRAQHRNHLEAMHDALTGLPNRRLMLERLRRSCAATPDPSSGAATGVLCLDLDGFKAVNDRYGHAAGDAILVHVANVLRASVRRGDIVSRLSGDEFVVLLPAIDEVRLRAVAECIVASVVRPVDLGFAQPVRVGISIGAARAGRDGAAAEDLLARADAALYEAKRGGKGRCKMAS